MKGQPVNNKKYDFYYDESEHSRKINHKTITADGYSDSFVAVVVGWLTDNQNNLHQKYDEFETKYKCRQSKGELKSTTIKLSQLKSGFASLNKDNIDLLEDFFNLFDEETHVYYAVISKIEYIVRQLFEGYENRLFVDMDAMKYSITKALVMYQPKNIMEGLYKDTGELVDLQRGFFLAQIEKNKTNEQLKRREIESFRQILILLDSISEIKSIDWNYDVSFVGFKKYLDEKAIDNYSLTIYKEENTATAARRVGLCSVSEADSATSCGIRMADMLAGIISKLMKSLHNALCYTSIEEQTKKKILGDSWFMVTERQLALYKKMHRVAIELNKAWYKAFAGSYSDDLVVFIAFLNFMNHFDSTDEIKKKLDMQGEYFNAYACESLAIHYERMRNKLPIDPVGDTIKDFFLNQRGAKVYFDTAKQPQLDIKKRRTVYDVLSVGFSKEKIPLITIQDDGEPKCYRLPIELSDWAIDVVALANMGQDLFPSKVAFSKIRGKCYVDIL